MEFSSTSEIDCWQDMEYPEKIEKLLDDDLLVDCEFLVGPEKSSAETIGGHKLMFALESPVFEAMMFGDFAEAKNHKIRIDDVLPQDFRNFRYILYHKDIENYSDFSLEQIFEIYRIANKYLVSSVCNNCISFLTPSATKSIPFERLILSYDFASKLEDKSLQAAIEKKISEYDVAIILNEKINDYSPKLFYDYILFVKKLSKGPTPISIFNAISSYFNHNNLIKNKVAYKNMDNKLLAAKDAKANDQICSDKEKDDTKKNGKMKCTEGVKEDLNDISIFKQNLLKLVSFNNMTTKEFIDGPGKSDLLDTKIKYKWLARISKNPQQQNTQNHHLQHRNY